MKRLALFVVLAAVVLTLNSCKTPTPGGTPRPIDVGGQMDDGGAAPAPVNCVSGVTQHAIADAQQRAITVISYGINIGSAEAVILKSLEGLAVDLVPGALACALSYLGIKLDYDAVHAKSEVATEKAAEAKIARLYLRKHGITFSQPVVVPIPAPMN